MICSSCHVGYMLQHPEQPQIWRKCTICGFCKKEKESNKPEELEDQSLGQS